MKISQWMNEPPPEDSIVGITDIAHAGEEIQKLIKAKALERLDQIEEGKSHDEVLPNVMYDALRDETLTGLADIELLLASAISLAKDKANKVNNPQVSQVINDAQYVISESVSLIVKFLGAWEFLLRNADLPKKSTEVQPMKVAEKKDDNIWLLE